MYTPDKRFSTMTMGNEECKSQRDIDGNAAQTDPLQQHNLSQINEEKPHEMIN